MTPQQFILALRDAERAQRAQRGLPISHILNMSEFPFAFAMDAVDIFVRDTAYAHAQNPEDPSTIWLCALASLATRDIERFNSFMELYQTFEPNKAHAYIRLGKMPSLAPVHLPNVIGEFPNRPALFLSCDGKYFLKYGLPLLHSISDHSPGIHVHIHLIDSFPALLNYAEKLPITFSATHEASPKDADKAVYYHAARLIRFSEALEKCETGMLMIDVDALVTGDIRSWLAGPLALRVRPARIEPWNQFSACFVRGDATSRPYFRRVAEIVQRSLSLSWWGLDQYALFSAAVFEETNIELVGPDVASVSESQPGLFWYTAGAKKEKILTSQTAYSALFRTYLSRKI